MANINEFEVVVQLIDEIGNLAITFQNNPIGAGLVVLLAIVIAVPVVRACTRNSATSHAA